MVRIALKVPDQSDQSLPSNCASLTPGGIPKVALYELKIHNSTSPELCGFIVFGVVTRVAG